MLQFIDKLFNESEELLLVITPNKTIININNKAVSYFGNIDSITEIEHLFSFEVCILNKKDLFEHSPLREALLTDIPIKTEVLLQLEQDKYKKFNLRSFKIEQDTVVIMSEISDPEKDKKIAELESANREFIQVKERAQNLAVRTALINRVSNSIRESLEIEKVINTVLSEINTTLMLDKGYFTYEKQDFKDSLVIPVSYHDEVLGYMALEKKSWNEEEIALLDGIAAQLASAINQARAQTQLIQSEKMASLGQLVAGVAHEINTPLGSINSNNGIFQKCIEKISGSETVVEILNDAIRTNSEAVSRINNLVKSLKNFARLDQAEFQEADLHEGIKNTLRLINHEIKSRIEVVEDYGEVPSIKCYPNQLNQVFMNVLVNAYQSIPDQGKITIKTTSNKNNVVVVISDTGGGIPKENLSKIFDPGFTTKSVGVGTGLGLSICYQIIQKHKGRISVESEVGKGTTFKIEIPK